MQNNNFVIGVHAQNELSTNAKGLLKGFEQIGIKALSVSECLENNIKPFLAIAFDSEGINQWQKLLSIGVNNVMWSTNSVFKNSYKIVKQFCAYKNFVLFTSTQADNEPIGTFQPNLIHGYIPHGVDFDFWSKNDNVSNKEFDVTIFANVTNADEKLKTLKETMPELVFELMQEVVNISLINPSFTLWNICSIIKSQMDLAFNDEQYELFMSNLSDIITTKQLEKTLSKLNGFKIKLVGNEILKSYETGNIQALEQQNDNETREIIQKSKIIIPIDNAFTAGGINDVVLKSASCESFVLAGIAAVLKGEFKETLGYFNPSTCEDLADKVSYYLNNEDERKSHSKQAQSIIQQNHTWKNRAKSIYDILSVE